MDLPSLYENLVKSVLSIVTDEGNGTGFFVRADGLILTNRHVVGANRRVQLQGNTGPSFEGEVLLSDRERDLCAIRALNLGIQTTPFLMIADSSNVRIGDDVFAIGNPSGSSSFSLAKGIISAVSHRAEDLPFLQASISINPGNSGGPLFQGKKLVCGMVTQMGRMLDNERVEGLCLAIPGEEMREFMERIPPFDEDFIHLVYCQICGKLEKKSEYCGSCGVRLEDQLCASDSSKIRPAVDENTLNGSRSCQACKAENHREDRYCEECGSDMRNQE